MLCKLCSAINLSYQSIVTDQFMLLRVWTKSLLDVIQICLNPYSICGIQWCHRNNGWNNHISPNLEMPKHAQPWAGHQSTGGGMLCFHALLQDLGTRYSPLLHKLG